jgi:methionine--tRNA ligase beta chain
MSTINFDEFKKVELKVGTVLEAARVEGSEKLLKMSVDLGEEAPRQIVAGIGKSYGPEDLVTQQIIVVANLEPRQLMGIESQGMVLACGLDEAILLKPFKQTVNGSLVR